MRLCLLALLLTGLSGCVSTQPMALDTPDGRAIVNVRASSSPARLHIDGEPVRHAVNLRIDAVEATWRDRFTGMAASAPTERVRAVMFRDVERGISRGALVGATTGLVVTLPGLAEGDSGFISPWSVIGVGVVLGTLVGGVFGGLFTYERMDTRPAVP